jgi:hypothetical protein
MSRQGIDPMINHTRGEYSNHNLEVLKHEHTMKAVV